MKLGTENISAPSGPSVSTLIKIAKAMGVSMPELFTDKDVLIDVNSIDTTLMERVALIDNLTKEEQNTIFSILDAFIGKRKLKRTLKTVLEDID